jgi:Fur family zinc uptake transcriptional regulator
MEPIPDKLAVSETAERVSSSYLDQAAACLAVQGTSLTPFREAVLHELATSVQPLGAYEIATRLGRLMGKSVAANSVYRVLDILLTSGLVQRVESKQAYCLSPLDVGAGRILLMCEDCGSIETIEGGAVAEALDQQSQAAHFRPRRKVIEVAGLCQSCDEAPRMKADVRSDQS